MKTTLLFLSVSLAGFGFGYLLTSGDPASGDVQASGESQGILDPSSTDATARQARSGAPGLDALSKALGPGHPLELLSRLSPESLLAALGQLDDVIAEKAMDELYDIDRTLALEIAQSSIEGRMYERLMNVWGKKDPLFFYDWMKSNALKLSEGAYDSLEVNTLWKMTDLDPEKAHAFASNLRDRTDREIVLVETARALAQVDPERGFEWLAKLSEDETVSQRVLAEGYKRIVSEYSKAKPREAAALVGQLDSVSLQRDLAKSIAPHFVAKDLSATSAWLDSLESPDVRAAGWNGILIAADEKDRAKYIESVLARPEIFGSDSTSQYELILNLAAWGTDQVAERFNQFFPESHRVTAAESLVSEMMDSDVQTAVDWVQSDLQGPAYEGAAVLIAEKFMYAKSDPKEAFRWAGEVSDPALRISMYQNFVDGSASDDLDLILESLDSLKLSYSERIDLEQRIGERMTDALSGLSPSKSP